MAQPNYQPEQSQAQAAQAARDQNEQLSIWRQYFDTVGSVPTDRLDGLRAVRDIQLNAQERYTGQEITYGVSEQDKPFQALVAERDALTDKSAKVWAHFFPEPPQPTLLQRVWAWVRQRLSFDVEAPPSPVNTRSHSSAVVDLVRIDTIEKWQQDIGKLDQQIAAERPQALLREAAKTGVATLGGTLADHRSDGKNDPIFSQLLKWGERYPRASADDLNAVATGSWLLGRVVDDPNEFSKALAHLQQEKAQTSNGIRGSRAVQSSFRDMKQYMEQYRQVLGRPGGEHSPELQQISMRINGAVQVIAHEDASLSAAPLSSRMQALYNWLKQSAEVHAAREQVFTDRLANLQGPMEILEQAQQALVKIQSHERDHQMQVRTNSTEQLRRVRLVTALGRGGVER